MHLQQMQCLCKCCPSVLDQDYIVLNRCNDVVIILHDKAYCNDLKVY